MERWVQNERFARHKGIKVIQTFEGRATIKDGVKDNPIILIADGRREVFMESSVQMSLRFFNIILCVLQTDS